MLIFYDRLYVKDCDVRILRLWFLGIGRRAQMFKGGRPSRLEAGGFLWVNSMSLLGSFFFSGKCAKFHPLLGTFHKDLGESRLGGYLSRDRLLQKFDLMPRSRQTNNRLRPASR